MRQAARQSGEQVSGRQTAVEGENGPIMGEQQFTQYIEIMDGCGVLDIEAEDRAAADQMHPLVLAYIGDSVYEIFVRTRLLQDFRTNVNRIHRASVDYVRASAQADVAHSIFEGLSEKEADIVRRARNAKSGYVPKNANVGEYRYATGFEALVGYLYIKQESERLLEILQSAAARVESRLADKAAGVTGNG